MMWLVVCGQHCRLVNITNQLLTMSNGGGTAEIERLRNLNIDLLTEKSKLSTVQYLQDEYLDARNESDRTKDNIKKVNNVNKTLAATFHMVKEKRTKGKGFMAMLIEHGGLAGTGVAPSVHQPTVGKCKHMSLTWTNWGTQRGSPCIEVLFDLRNQMPVAWPPEPL